MTLKRSPLRRAEPTARASVPVFKPRKCAVCRDRFTPTKPMQKVCGWSCACQVAAKQRVRELLEKTKADRRETKAKLEKLKGVPKLKKEAQEAFNRYVRLRDNGKGCFVCETPLQMGGVGGGFDAGHIRSRSNADNLRFDERNVHGQCKECNAVGATKDWEMRAAAIRKLGESEAEALYNDNAPIKWTRDGLREIRDKYRALTKELTK